MGPQGAGRAAKPSAHPHLDIIPIGGEYNVFRKRLARTFLAVGVVILASAVPVGAKTKLVVWDWWGLGTHSLQAWFNYVKTEFEK